MYPEHSLQPGTLKHLNPGDSESLNVASIHRAIKEESFSLFLSPFSFVSLTF